jgi:hypothetical protein
VVVTIGRFKDTNALLNKFEQVCKARLDMKGCPIASSEIKSIIVIHNIMKKMMTEEGQESSLRY